MFRCKHNILFCMLAMMLCLLGTGATAQKPEEMARQNSLRNIKAVRVQVADFAADFKAEFNKAGLTEGLIETMTERRLEDAGIKVLQEFEPDPTAQTGILTLSIRAHSPVSARRFTMTGEGIEFSAPGGQPPYLYLIKIELRQKVVLTRDPAVGLTLATWSADTFGIRRLSRLTQVIDDLTNQFIQAYGSGNP